ncbi:Protein INVOLVED IN DE NOVO 2 [Linum perenne]
MQHMGDDGDAEILKNLKEKEDELDSVEALNQTLIVKERKSNDELQDARKELVNVSNIFVVSVVLIFSYCCHFFSC